MGHRCGSLGAAWRSHGAPLWLPWCISGASLAQEDFEGKTNKLAERFIKNSQDWTSRFLRPDSDSCTWTPRIEHPDSDSQRYHLQLLVI